MPPQLPRGEPRPAARFRPAFVQQILEAQRREREHLLREVLKARGLMPLLMRQRNGGRWTSDERKELRERLNALSQISPYLVAMAVPGSLLMLPMLAWWLDRRRGRR
ncbi:MAG: hypothetical protein EFKGCFLK_00278 [Rhodocyclaceae bacterium]|nr:hypothetical protein [Rhodocyclaceae bacterium]CAG0931005.1 hypothetical protein RHDC3_01718 [Rhodocyclaceae bacterium]